MTVELPATGLRLAIASPADPQSTRSEPERASGLRILLVDDHEDTLRVMSRLLKGLSHEVTTASSIEPALAAAATKKFDLIISDLGLGVESGRDLMRELLKRQPIRGTALTGNGTGEDVRQTRERRASPPTSPSHRVARQQTGSK